MKVNQISKFVQPNFTANIMPKNCAEHINNKLLSAKSVDIFCHTSSDEDSFNSAKAMYSYLQSKGVKPRIIVSNGRECYKYDTNQYDILQADKVDAKTQKSDMALCLDFSAESRVSPTVLKYLSSYGDKVVGIDHHNNSDKISTSFNQITQSYASIQKMPKLEAKDFYIDSSAKSNCSIISRFFNAIGHKITQGEAKSLMTGILDDTMKDGFTSISPKKEVKISDKINDCGNTKHVLKNVLAVLTNADKTDVINHLLKKTNLTKEEIRFQKDLSKRTKFSKNGRFAYVEIRQGDKEWDKIGRDTVRSKHILSEYRKSMLQNDGIDAVAVFFPTNLKNTYKMSILSKKDYAKQIIENIKNTSYPQLTAGGHDDRSGGTLTSKDDYHCQKWVKLFVDSAEQVLS